METFGRALDNKWLSNSPAIKLLGKCSINLSGQSISDSHFLDYLVNHKPG
jgi:hypothetical protein